MRHSNIYLEEKLFIKREADLRKLFKSLYGNPTGPPSIKITNKHQRYIGLCDSVYQDVTDHRKWRFKSYNKLFYIEYFERWMVEEDLWYLERAYLHLKKIKSHNEMEDFLALHCDPLIEKTEDHYKFKIGPHLHIECADYPLPKSHFALNLTDLDKVLSSTVCLTKAIESALELIKDQVLELY